MALNFFDDGKKRLNEGHRIRDLEEQLIAKNRVKLRQNVFSTKRQFRDMFNDFMAPRPTDTLTQGYWKRNHGGMPLNSSSSLPTASR